MDVPAIEFSVTSAWETSHACRRRSARQECCPLRRSIWCLPIVFLASMLGTKLAAQDPRPIQITGIVRAPGSGLTVTHTTAPGFYFVLLRGEEVTQIRQPIDLQLT